MNTVVIKRGITQIAASMTLGKPLFVLLLLALFFINPQTAEVTSVSLVDAYLQVSVFVAATLAVLFFFERLSKTNLENYLRRNRRLHVPVAALFGALPGCGGAIVVTTQYVRGSMNFGGVVAVLAATMGDAAFLLLAQRPFIALCVFATCLVTGIISGYIVELIHDRDFMMVDNDSQDREAELIEENELLTPLYKLWMALFIPGAIVGLMIAFQYDPGIIAFELVGFDFVTPIALFAGILSVLMWMLNPLSDFRLHTSRSRSIGRRIADTTNFVTFWVIVGYVGYGLLETIVGIDFRSLFSTWTVFLPLIGLLIGFIPGCGPQIIVTTLYLSGSIPLSALLANAISNDGDALFPAIAAAPRAAVLATLYTAVPALLVGYGYYFVFE